MTSPAARTHSLASVGHDGPIRTCVACRAKRPQASLLRFRRRPDGEVVLGIRPGQSGRGAYICPGRTCFSLAVRRNALARSLAGSKRSKVRSITAISWSSVLEGLDSEVLSLRRTSSTLQCDRLAMLNALRAQIEEPGNGA